MNKRAAKARQNRRFKPRLEEQAVELTKATPTSQPTAQKLGPHYAAGPMAGLLPPKEEETGSGSAAKAEGVEANVEPEAEVAPLPTVRGRGPAERVQVYSTPGSSIRLAGRTDADFDGGSFHTKNIKVRRGSGCVGCPARDCVRVTGMLVATYSVTTTVTLPSVDDFPNLTACQRRRVQQAITNVLAPHEQAHVRAFNRYNGTTRRAFDLTLCRGDFDSAIDGMFSAEEQARRQAAQAASDALDPFHFDVDLNCADQSATVLKEEEDEL